MHENLIQRLQQRIRRAPSTDLERVPAIQPRPPLAPDKTERAELDLGFRLPPLLRSLYLEVADGGYGPGWGILPIDEIVEWDHRCRANGSDIVPPRNWPEKLIRFCEWGCNFWSGIDCSSDRCAILRFDPDRDAAEIRRSSRGGMRFTCGMARGVVGWRQALGPDNPANRTER